MMCMLAQVCIGILVPETLFRNGIVTIYLCRIFGWMGPAHISSCRECRLLQAHQNSITPLANCARWVVIFLPLNPSAVFKCVSLVIIAKYYSDLNSLGRVDNFLYFTNAAALFFKNISKFGLLYIIAKGWCITRTFLVPQEALAISSSSPFVIS